MEKSCLAAAKINLCLHVLGRRPDGYHEVRMVMQQVSLCDRIRIAVEKGDQVTVLCPGLELPPGTENLAAKAARRILEAAGKRVAVRIEIEKRIPAAAGLGGGSSDAAAVLKALNAMLDLGFDGAALERLALPLGADVPFFIRGGAALAEGIGERLSDFVIEPAVGYVLINPGFAVSTAWVYRNLVLTSKGDEANLARFVGCYPGLLRLLHNDLESVTLKHFPVLDDIKTRLLEAGADAALMSGSGPTIFGLFRDRAAARAAGEELALTTPWQVFPVEPCS
ncbi:MAG: 4-(cytidine 5'-diphospho)-2-C-methyl-D-erythritol kinase [Deltaproteobacteria bacterium]|nr:4-(cytidine 5'-diphospho)-2-C-methyl-D-erythritol kinase [Deltaproteobacteria bacterium]